MKEKIEAKIADFVESILAKATIDHADYQILMRHLEKINAEESQKKWESEKDERNAAFKNLMLGIINQ